MKFFSNRLSIQLIRYLATCPYCKYYPAAWLSPMAVMPVTETQSMESLASCPAGAVGTVISGNNRQRGCLKGNFLDIEGDENQNTLTQDWPSPWLFSSHCEPGAPGEEPESRTSSSNGREKEAHPCN